MGGGRPRIYPKEPKKEPNGNGYNLLNAEFVSNLVVLL
jgi:hypothetical protein